MSAFQKLFHRSKEILNNAPLEDDDDEEEDGDYDFDEAIHVEGTSDASEIATKQNKQVSKPADSPKPLPTPVIISSSKAKKAPADGYDTSDSEDIASDDDEIHIIKERKVPEEEEDEEEDIEGENEFPELTNASSDKQKKKTITAVGANELIPKKDTKKESDAFYKEKFRRIVGKEHAQSLLAEYKKITKNPNNLPTIKLMEEQNAFIISVHKTYPEIPSRCFMQIFGIGSNRLTNFIKKGILTRKKPGGLNGKEVNKEMKKDLCDYVNSLRMEEVTVTSKVLGINQPTTFLKLIDETSYTALHERYVEHFKSKEPSKKFIEKYKTFYEHFHRLFPDVQLNKASKNKKSKKKTYSAMDLDIDQ